MTMRVRAALVLCLLTGLALARVAFAQEGHPLVGTWYGDWGTSPTQRTQITVVMTWDGKNISGIIDPGPDAYPIKTATLDSTTSRPRLMIATRVQIWRTSLNRWLERKMVFPSPTSRRSRSRISTMPAELVL